MSFKTPCPCLLCNTETRLLADLSEKEEEIIKELFLCSHSLRKFTSVSALLRHLRAISNPAESDGLLGDLCALRLMNPPVIESLLVLAFLPMLHATIGKVTQLQSELALEDVTQQALHFLLQFLASEELRLRNSHVAFAISRAVKRKTFEWANRQNAVHALEQRRGLDGAELSFSQESLERHATLWDFLHTALSRKLLNAEELNLLIDCKLQGYGGRDFEANGLGSSNMLRQRLKRLLAKLRRLART